MSTVGEKHLRFEVGLTPNSTQTYTPSTAIPPRIHNYALYILILQYNYNNIVFLLSKYL